MGKSNMLFDHLSRIARARTEEEFERKVDLLKDDEELWGNSLFRKWLEKTWLKQHKASPSFFGDFHYMDTIRINHCFY